MPRDYTYDEGLLITKEMAEKLCMDIFDKDVTARSMTLEIVYGGRERDSDRGTYKFPTPTNAVSDAVNGAVSIYEKITDRNRKVRKISVCFNNAEKEKCEQLDFFSDTVGKEREKTRMKAINGIRKRYGKNSIFKGRDLEDCATAKERNNQIGGHKSGEK